MTCFGRTVKPFTGQNLIDICGEEPIESFSASAANKHAARNAAALVPFQQAICKWRGQWDCWQIWPLQLRKLSLCATLWLDAHYPVSLDVMWSSSGSCHLNRAWDASKPWALTYLMWLKIHCCPGGFVFAQGVDALLPALSLSQIFDCSGEKNYSSKTSWRSSPRNRTYKPDMAC